MRKIDTKGALKRAGIPVAEQYRELEACDGIVDLQILQKARELAAKIRLNFLTFQAKMNKTCVFYEQESGELDIRYILIRIFLRKNCRHLRLCWTWW